jgi:uncharacterized protein
VEAFIMRGAGMKWLFSLAVLLAAAGLAQGQVPLTTLGSPYTQNFDTLANSATSSTVPTGWAFVESGSAANATYTAGTGSSTAGDTYSFGPAASTERAFGALQSGALVPTIGASFNNSTGATIASLTISYTGEQWRLGTTARTDRLDFQYSTDATTLTTGTWVDVNSLDFTAPFTATVGAVDGNAAANRTALTFTITGLSIAPGATFFIRWSDFNATGSDDGLSVDNFSITPAAAVAGPNLTIGDVSLSEGDSGTTSFVFTVQLSAPAGAGGVTFDIATADNSATAANNDYAAQALTGQTIGVGNSSATFTVLVNGDPTQEPNETFFVNVTNVTGATVVDGQGQGTITNDDISISFVHDIQGTGTSSPLVGQSVTINGIVVGDFQGATGLQGFFVQEEDADADANPLTSEGIFVFDGSSPAVNVNVGDKVQVAGTVTEFSSSGITLTELGSPAVTVQTTGSVLPTPPVVAFPVASATDLEKFEGMRVQITQPMVVNDNFSHGSFGELQLSANGRRFTGTHLAAPGASAVAVNTANLLQTIVLDDGSGVSRQNFTTWLYPEGGLSAANVARVGETVDGAISGILDHRFGTYRIQPTAAVTFLTNVSNPRPVTAPAVGGRLRVASANVLNFFTTLDVGTNICGPSASLGCRGANNATEFNRQRDKMVQVLNGMDAHVLGLTELENNATASIQSVVDGLNAITPGKYDFINTGTFGTDAIKVGIIYQPAVVTPVGGFAVLSNSVDIRAIDTRNRPSLAQTFRPVAGVHTDLQRFTLVVNHFKSKGSSCTSVSSPGEIADPLLNDGQEDCNLTRTSIAAAVVSWVAANPTSDPTPAADRKVLLVGDLNSYAKEDPISALTSPTFTKQPVLTVANPGATYVDLPKAFEGTNAYSYVFSGASGYLDYALANRVLSPLVTGTADWHVNADEPIATDYNTEWDNNVAKSAGQITSLYAANQFRASDHDPVLVGLNPLCGDLDNDGDVDAADSLLMRGVLGQAASLANRRMNFDGDGTISLNDYRQWLACQQKFTQP